VNTVMNLRVHKMRGISWLAERTISFSTTLLRGVKCWQLRVTSVVEYRNIKIYKAFYIMCKYVNLVVRNSGNHYTEKWNVLLGLGGDKEMRGGQKPKSIPFNTISRIWKWERKGKINDHRYAQAEPV
jgi:hypothetical protein